MKEYKSSVKLFDIKYNKTDFKRVKIQTSQDAADYIRQFYGDDMECYESFFVLLMNRANNTIGYAKISQGGICGTVVDPIIVAKYAIESLATGVILAHNHPSGNLIPSNADLQITEKIKTGLNLFGVNVMDHVILTANSYYSFADDGKL